MVPAAAGALPRLGDETDPAVGFPGGKNIPPTTVRSLSSSSWFGRPFLPSVAMMNDDRFCNHVKDKSGESHRKSWVGIYSIHISHCFTLFALNLFACASSSCASSGS